jgi:anti-sigma regulatory factor (Ser/Thr protein kinase)
MTAHGSEDAAAEALRRGATSYVPKKYLSRDLLETVDRVLGVAGVAGAANTAITAGGAGAGGEAAVAPPGEIEPPGLASEPDSAAQAVRYLQTTSCRFVVDDNPPHLDPLVRYVEREVARMGLFDDTGRMRLGIALSEALANAVNHGNLALGSELRETDLSAYYRLLDERRATPPYRDRKVYVSAEVTRAQVVLVVRDEGAGFDPHDLPDPTDPASLEKTSGRGMLLIRTFMDEVRHNEAGNEITMVKFTA